MKNKNYSVLLIGNFESSYIIQFVEHLKRVNPNVHIFFWGYKRDKNEIDRSFVDCYDEYCLFDRKKFIKSSLFWPIKILIELRKSFREFVKGKHFDFVSIQYIKPEYFFLVNYFKKYASYLVLTPWGSDVYRIGAFYKLLLKRIFNRADFITGPDDRFTRDFTKIFNVPLKKIVHCDLGVEPIEYIINHKDQIGCNEAKHQLGVDNCYVITCGYNANPAQKHLKIIEAIQKIKDELPHNLILFFPLTYPNNQEYSQVVKQKVEENGLKAVFFEKYLDLPNLFLVRQATDIFIHVQPSDASSGTLYEYILCEKKILNGAWLEYPDIEKYGVKPYYLLDSLENLGQAIVKAYKSEPIKIDKQVLTDLGKKQWKVVIKDWDCFFSCKMI